ncbi:MAG: GGDEF domain-containing phosphodiesterase [Treponema sp.]|nr:GGDEF domain-containing phosphodiesterase [Treponema sp.]
MSKKQDRRIKRFKRKAVWPRVIGMIFTDTILLGCAIYLSYLAIIGLYDSAVLDNMNECNSVVRIVNNEWTGTQTKEFDERIKNSLEFLSSVNELYLVNPDLEILAAYGESNPNFEEIFYENQLRNLGSDTVLTRSTYELEERGDYSIGFTDKDSADQLSSRISDALSFSSFDTNLPSLNYNRLPYLHFSNWTIHKTNNPLVYACIKSKLVITNFHRNFASFLVVMLVILFLFCFIYEIIRLVSYVIGAHQIDSFMTTDFITGGKNREYFVRVAKKRIKRNKLSYAVVQLRVEKYRNYCISYGVKTGESLLEHVSLRLEHLVSKKELSAHVEKSDFALLLAYETEEDLLKRINKIFEILIDINTSQHLAFAAGIKKVESRTDDVNNLLTEAALALREVDGKVSGIAWFNDKMKESQIWERRIEDDMEKALENHEFQLYLQPKYATKKETLAAAEALVRWIHPELGFISPAKFIPIFETNGFILKLDDYMLNAVAQRQATWMKQGKQLVPISVNVSRAHFTREDLADHICGIVDKYNVPHEYIELELTESAFFDDKSVLLNTVKKLKEYGFAVSMDDFGAGYSSLNSLKELPLDVIKLDAQFFREIDDIERANLIVGDTICLAKKLGMQIVAEGIETREQVDFLANQDCDLIQGFYFAKPLPVNEFEQRAYPSTSASS